jgi:hypothetical protein
VVGLRRGFGGLPCWGLASYSVEVAESKTAELNYESMMATTMKCAQGRKYRNDVRVQEVGKVYLRLDLQERILFIRRIHHLCCSVYDPASYGLVEIDVLKRFRTDIWSSSRILEPFPALFLRIVLDPYLFPLRSYST